MEAAKLVAQESSGIDILINNAAVHLESALKNLEELDLEDIPKTFAVNTIGPLRVTKFFMPLLENGQRKLIVNISSESRQHL